MTKKKLERSRRHFSVVANWGARSTDATQLAKLSLLLNERLSSVTPLLSNWHSLLNSNNFEPINKNLTHLVEKIEETKVLWNDKSPSDGAHYRMSCRNTSDENWSSRHVSWDASAGSDRSYLSNWVGFQTDYGVTADKEFTNYNNARSIILAIAEVFDADYAQAYPSAICDLWPPQRRNDLPNLNLAWLSYVAPRFVHLIDVPPNAIVERRPDGGFLFSATTDQFDPGNADHMSASQAIVDGAARFVRHID